MKKIILNPEIFLIENFFSDEECNRFLKQFENQKFEEAKININGSQIMNKRVRNNDRILFFDEDLAVNLWGKIKEFIPKKLGVYNAIGLNEMFRVYKYSKGQRFKMHIDGSYKRNENECSFFSFLIYLNENFEGGETEFRRITTVKPKREWHWFFVIKISMKEKK